MSLGSLALIHAKMLAIFTILHEKVNTMSSYSFDLTVSLKKSQGLVHYAFASYTLKSGFSSLRPFVKDAIIKTRGYW